MEMGDGFNPEIGDEGVVVDVEFTVLVADGGDEAIGRASGANSVRPGCHSKLPQ